MEPLSVDQVDPGFLAGISEQAVCLMGFSFILGSMVTILILMLLDFTRRNNPNPPR